MYSQVTAPSDPISPRRPLAIRVGSKLRPHIDQMMAPFSLVGNDAVLDSANFPWVDALRSNWRAIREEALAVTREPNAVPPLSKISPDHQRIGADQGWRSFFLVGYGARIEQNIERCPVTTSLLKHVPGLNSGFFSILRPGTHIPRHTGVTKGLITCHLALVVPEGPLRMNLNGEDQHWREGETLFFDDTYPHEVWNETGGTRIVLLIQFERPLRQPGRAIARAFLDGIKRSAFVQDAVANIDRWQNPG
ncbi:aspartyl/asparaginyl beta-hydroxylase domain-containing protein [Novosphingobium terrae]|uniref:aspartyl/asparaginyl beta-hydroxylase domain-containing protein n=1 Tax=Novosphingobium terrae TaxID=2726189 RepID=UPI001980FCAA|nr:aspartyl/asparaginyl beta-hydroxylase domain-containing protein [Novosphingobium terrae]